MTGDGVAASGWSTYVGLMSGTSLDGISAAVVRFSDGTPLRHELLAYTVHDYTPSRRDRLIHALSGTTAEEYCRLNFELGGWLADAALAAIASAGVPATDIRAIGSHGQTVWHVPGHSTWQSGESAVIAERTGRDVVSDFRVRDVAAGGQGAPLVPVADAMLFASPSRWRLLQNLGGMANVTVVPPGGELAHVRAFDTGPGVAVIDAVVRALWPRMRFDVDGRLALAGKVIEPVVSRLLSEPYFAALPPKSTGRELFGIPYAGSLVQECRSARPGACDEDVVATAVALTARSIARAYSSFVSEPAHEVIVSGGGAMNPALRAALRAAIAPRQLRLFSELYYNGEAKEAVAFALLAHLHLTRADGNVAAATGARGPRILGKLTPA